MKKLLLFSLFVGLTGLAFGQYGGGCGDYSSSSGNTGSSYTGAYTYVKPQEAVKVDFRVFPNPTTDYFVLDAESLDKGSATRIQVYNLAGQAVRSFTVAKDARYNLADLENGMYLLQFLDAKDKTITTRKLYKADRLTRF